MRIETYISKEERANRLANIPNLRKRADDGDVPAQIELAWELAEGRIIDADFVSAASYFERAAQSGDETAVLNQAVFLHLRRVPAGTRTIRAFAIRNNALAQFWLGRHYQRSWGHINQLRAAAWYKRSSTNGSIAGQFAFFGQQLRLAPLCVRPLLFAKAVVRLVFLASRAGPQIEREGVWSMRQLKHR